MKCIILLFALAITPGSSQDVKVTHVDPALTVRAKAAWQALKAAEAAWEGVKTETEKRYLIHDVSFSEDFTVLVPKGTTGTLSLAAGPTWNPCYTTVPALGSTSYGVYP